MSESRDRIPAGQLIGCALVLLVFVVVPWWCGVLWAVGVL